MRVIPLTFFLLFGAAFASAQERPNLIVEILDKDSLEPLAARVYLRSLGVEKTWLHVEARGEGSAVPYHKDRGASVEIHTSVTHHGFQATLAPGRYELVIERGKEYIPLKMEFEAGDEPVELTMRIERWSNMASLGWYSGETHIHRTLAELPAAMLAEDLNVGFPLTYWVTDSEQIPARDRRSTEPEPLPELVQLDSTHVYWPINTEYEIFTVKGQRHTLGALFVLNHERPLKTKAPPIGPVVENIEGDRQILLDMDKHNWPWSMMIVPETGVNLFELTNNHLWRTEFLFGDWYRDYVPSHFEVEKAENGDFTERGWIDYGLQTYYMLLNCGFRMQPTGGTASGVHPVPVGFGRVYVYLEDGFDFDAWVDGLAKGHSFVTTGPMIDVRFHGRLPGTSLPASEWNLDERDEDSQLRITGTVRALEQIDRIEAVINGKVVPCEFTAEQEGRVSMVDIECDVPVHGSSWIALRCFTKTESGRLRFAHSAPVYVNDPNRPLQPSADEVEFLVRRMEEELDRHMGVLDENSLEEYRSAKAKFQSLRRSENE